MSGLIDHVSNMIWRSLGPGVLTAVLLLGPAFLMPDPFASRNTGLLPFLMSPFVLVIVVPHLCTMEDATVRTTFFQVIGYSVYIGFLFAAAYLLFGSPRLIAILKGTAVISGLAVLISGLYVLVRGLWDSTFLAQWCSTVMGLLITGSFIYLSPVVDQLYAERVLRENVIRFATDLNPILAMSGSILQQDLLRGAFLYEHLSIGRYYAYSVPDWRQIVFIYFTSGVGMYGLGVWINRNEEENNSSPTLANGVDEEETNTEMNI